MVEGWVVEMEVTNPKISPKLRKVLEMVKPEATIPVIVELNVPLAGEAISALEGAGLTIKEKIPTVGMVSGKIQASLVDKIASLPFVKEVYYDEPVSIQAEPFFRIKGKESVLVPVSEATTGKEMGVDTVWGEFGLTGKGVKVAVLDTGASVGHPMLRDAIAETFSMVEGESVEDKHGHGTWCSAAIAGRPHEDMFRGHMFEVVGMAPEADLIVGKVLSNEGSGQTSWVIKGMEKAAELGADIISMSLGSMISEGGRSPDSKMVDALSRKGILCVVAAGNSALPLSIGSPGDARGAMTVGSVAYDTPAMLIPSTFESRGPTIDWRIKPDVTCIAEGEFVYKNLGCVAIEKVDIGDTVFNVGMGNVKRDEVISTVYNGVKEVVEVRTDHNSIKVTPDHRFLVLTYGVVDFSVKLTDRGVSKLNNLKKKYSAKELTRMMGIHQMSLSRILRGERGILYSRLVRLSSLTGVTFDDRDYEVNNYKVRDWSLMWKRADELEINKDMLVTISRMPEGDLTEVNGVRLTEDLCLFIGVYLGDGCLDHNDRGILLYIPEGDRFRDKYEMLSERLFGRVHKEKTRLTIRSKDAVDIVKKLDLAHKAIDKYIPDWCYKIPDKMKLKIVEGLIDSDGYWIDDKQATIEMASEGMIRGIKALLHSIGILTSNIHRRVRDNYNTGLTGVVKRYTETWSIYISFKPVHKYGYNNLPEKVRRMLPEGTFVEKVRRVTPVGKSRVYDLAIKDDHCFIVNGFVVHNCFGGNVLPEVTELLVTAGTGTSLTALAGTSMATPQVAGITALLVQAGLPRDRDILEYVFSKTGKKRFPTVFKDPDTGWGLPNVAKAIEGEIWNSPDAQTFNLFSESVQKATMPLSMALEPLTVKAAQLMGLDLTPKLAVVEG